LVLSARSNGDDGNNLRAKIDYDTADPDRTFNLIVFRESISPTGNSDITEEEKFKGLSMDPTNVRYAPTVVKRDSLLCTADVSAEPAGTAGVSVGGRLMSTSVTGSTYGTVAAALIATKLGGSANTGRFRITVGNQSGVASLSASTFTLGATAVTTAVANSAQVDVTVTFQTVGSYSTIVFTANNAGDEVRIEPVPDSSVDLTVLLGLGVAQGGVEYGAFSAHRPRANGIISQRGTDAATDVARLIALAAMTTPTKTDPSATPLGSATDPNRLVIAGPESPFTMSLQPPESWGSLLGRKIETSTTDPVTDTTTLSGDVTLANLAAYMKAAASTINANAGNPGWYAAVQGMNLVINATYGSSTAGMNHYVDVGPTWFVSASALTNTGLFTGDVDNNTLSAGSALGSGTANINGLDAADYTDAFNTLESKVDLFNILVLPRTLNQTPDARQDVWGNASTFCQNNRAFLIIDPTSDAIEKKSTIDNALQIVTGNRVGIVKDHSAMYWPRVAIKPDSSRRYVDPAGTIAGVMARIDGSRGVWKAPAGTEADLRGVFGVETPMSDRENGRLNPEALNCIRAFTSGIISWGARTMDGFDNSGNDDYKYVPVRRFALFLEESLYRGLKWAVFEPNDHRLWSQIRMTVSSFMNGLYRQGAFFGETSKEAYFVKVDAETTTPNDINLGICNVVVGFAPVKPAEFIVVTIKQKAGQVQV
jgi:phage tail sheath protein FI